MVKKVGIIFFIFAALISSEVLAHTGLKESTPKDGEVLTATIEELTLLFETKVEQTSNVIVSTSVGENIVLEEVVVDERKMTAIFQEPLVNGEYRVNWSIIGVDGHLVEGTLTFVVDAPNAESVGDVPPDEETIQPDAVEVVSDSEQKENQQTQLPSYFPQLIVSVAIIAVIGGLWWFLRRNRA